MTPRAAGGWPSRGRIAAMTRLRELGAHRKRRRLGNNRVRQHHQLNLVGGNILPATADRVLHSMKQKNPSACRWHRQRAAESRGYFQSLRETPGRPSTSTSRWRYLPYRAVCPDWRPGRWTRSYWATDGGGHPCQRGNGWPAQVRAMEHRGGSWALAKVGRQSSRKPACDHLLARRPPASGFGIGSPGAGTTKNSAI